MRALFFVLITLVFIPALQAAIPPLKSVLNKQNKYIESGSIIGGVAQKDLVLTGVRRTFSKAQNLERIVFEITSSKNEADRAGYYNIAIDQKLKRVVIDIDGVAASIMPLETIMSNLKRSPLIDEATLTMDPQDRSANITLALKKIKSNYKIEAFEMAPLKTPGRQSARFVLDIVAPKKVARK